MVAVTLRNLTSVISKLLAVSEMGLDTETQGNGEDARLFSIAISTSEGDYYFNFNQYAGLNPEFVLPRNCIKELGPVFLDKNKKFFIHNALFDMKILSFEGIEILGDIHDSFALERLVKNNM